MTQDEHLAHAIEEIAQALGGTLCVAVRDARRGKALDFRADERLPSASVIKVAILVELMARVEERDFSLIDRVPLRDADRVPGSGVLSMLHEGLECPAGHVVTLDQPALLFRAHRLILLACRAQVDHGAEPRGFEFRDLMGGRLTYTFDSLALQVPHVKAGKIRALAVTSTKRAPTLQDVPTVSESGLPQYDYLSWRGIAAPAGTPREIIAQLNAVVAKILRTPEARDWFAEQGGEPVGDTPEEFAAFIKQEYVRWGPIVREAGIRAD